MPIQGSGTISISDIVNEFGGSVPHSLSEYYRGGGAVPSSVTGVPASGAISLNNFYSAANAIALTISSETTNYQTSTAFGSNWAANVPKTLTIPSGVTVGSENANAALIINSGMGGSLIIHNSGSIQGSGGEGSESGTGGDGGPAVQALQNGNVTFNNNAGGEVYAGGGGGGVGGAGGTGGSGGTGGAGGNGKYLVTWHSGNVYFGNHYGCHGYCCSSPGYQNPGIGGYLNVKAQTSCSAPSNGDGSYINHSSDQVIDSQFTRGRFRYYRAQMVVSFRAHATGGSGGAGGGGGAGGVGGAGGKGKGYKQTRTDGKAGGNAAPGSAGSGGASPSHPNAGYGGDGGNGGIGGAGGAGGNGGTWGTAGGTGSGGSAGGSGTSGTTGGTGFNLGSKAGTTAQNTGSSGNGGSSGNAGSSGSSGGAAGAYVVNRGYITFNNNGSVAGT